MKLTLFLVFIGLVLGNFGYQAINKHLWSVAWERSFFQAIALIAVLLFAKHAGN